MASPEPPVALKDHCSIIHDNTLYVYSPDAFQTLPLQQNATWTQEENGVSVTGAVCAKGGVDGDGENPALYVVGGTTNGSVSDYSGIQRYSIRKKVWETINPTSTVTANRINHGATYLNSSSAILVYGGSQDGDTGYSTETFLMLMYPPYRVQAYSSIAPAVKKPFVLPFSEGKAVMVGGGNGNQAVFTFDPESSWLDLGVKLPFVLPDPSTAQVNLQWLADGTRVLQTYYTDESPNRVTRNVLTNPGFVPASYGQTIGASTNSSNSRLFRRQLIQGNYPAYNSSDAPSEQRTGASLASSTDLVAIVGGDSNSTVAVFNSSANSWVDSKAIFGDTQKPLTTSSSTIVAAPTSTASQTRAATSAASSVAAASTANNQSNGLAILGGVLGGICGFAAILIIALLWLRSTRKRKAAEAAATGKKQNESSYPDDKPQNFAQDNVGGLKPLSQQAQPMGRSPVPSAVISEPDSIAIFGGRLNEKSSEPGEQSRIGSKLNPNHSANNSIGGLFKSNNRTPLSISKPMQPNLGDYQQRASIDLGTATPSAAPVLPLAAVAASSQQKADQRKTDEGWAKYFQADQGEKKKQQDNDYLVAYEDDPRRSSSRPSTGKNGTGFWPGSGVPSSNRSTKLPLRDSAGNLLNHATVATASPSLETGHYDLQTRNMSVATPVQAKISSADSISTDQSSDDGYEDDDMDGYSDGRDSYQHNSWNPIGNTWSGPSQRTSHAASSRLSAAAFPPPTNLSEGTMNTSGSGGSSIPSFPMPAAGVGRADGTDQYIGTSTAQAPPRNHYAPPSSFEHARKSSNTFHNQVTLPVQDYFGPPGTATSQGSGKLPDSTDMSWLNLGTPAHMHGSRDSSGSQEPMPAHVRGDAHSGGSPDPA